MCQFFGWAFSRTKSLCYQGFGTKFFSLKAAQCRSRAWARSDVSAYRSYLVTYPVSGRPWLLAAESRFRVLSRLKASISTKKSCWDWFARTRGDPGSCVVECWLCLRGRSLYPEKLPKFMSATSFS